MGTGSFSLNIDSQMIKTQAQNMKEQFGYDFDEIGESPSGQYLSPQGSRTPMQPESERMVNDIIAGQTSQYGVSHRSAYTPGYDLGFSPHADQFGSPANFYASPAHYQQSPGYGSPIGMGASPIYMAQNAAQSPAYTGASPIYSNPQQLKGTVGQSPNYSPSRTIPSGAKPYSPIYNGAQGATSTGKSPAYSPTSNLRGATGSAPSPMAQNQSPAYSPSSISK